MTKFDFHKEEIERIDLALAIKRPRAAIVRLVDDKGETIRITLGRTYWRLALEAFRRELVTLAEREK